LASLPTLREFQELSSEHRELVEKEAPAAPPPMLPLDPQVKAAVDALGEDSDAALAELEQAISAADAQSKSTTAVLGAAQGSPVESDETSPP